MEKKISKVETAILRKKVKERKEIDKPVVVKKGFLQYLIDLFK